jgi:hypothetical protein
VVVGVVIIGVVVVVGVVVDVVVVGVVAGVVSVGVDVDDVFMTACNDFCADAKAADLAELLELDEIDCKLF